MIQAEVKEWLAENLFQVKSFEEIWFDIKQLYEAMGFSDKLTDKERIEEYTYISQQLRKYVSSKQDVVLSKDTYGDMVLVLEDLIAKAPEYSSIRKELVYGFLRDHWLLEVYGALSRFMENDEEEEEEE